MSTDPTGDLLQALAIDRSPPPRAKRWPWVLAMLVIMCAAAGWLWQQQRPLPIRTTVVTAPERSGPGERSVLEATGYVTARRQATVASKITGRVAELKIEEGQHVVADEILATLDGTDALADLALAQAQLEAAEAGLADLRVQEAQAIRDAHRQDELRSRKLNSTQAQEDAHSQRASVAARLVSQQRQIAVSRRNVERAAVGVDNTIIRAPFTGVITVKAAQPGEIVSPISAGGGFTRTGIGTIVDMSSLEIEVDINEAYISRVRDGQAVSATLNAYPDWQLSAHVITIIPTADRAKATVKVRIAIDQLDARIVPEMGVRVSFLEAADMARTGTSTPRGVLVPVATLVADGDRNRVWVVREGRVEARPVTLGQQQAGQREILSGLAAGEVIVLQPPTSLQDGQRVTEETPR